jgi:hypothetical protein
MEQKVKSKNTPKALKYKLYKQLRVDMWGSFVFKKKNNKFTLRLLRNFEFILTKKILRSFDSRAKLNRCFPAFFGFSFFKKNPNSDLRF